MTFQYPDFMVRRLKCEGPLACPATPERQGPLVNPLARFMLANERLRCRGCGEAALALHWRFDGSRRGGDISPE